MRYTSYIEVNFGHMGQNFELIKNLAPKAKILPMVKADAYGNGLVPVSQFLVKDCEVARLGCATLGEALHLVRECPDLDVESWVFSDTELMHEKAREAYLHYRIRPVLSTMNEIEIVLKDPAFKKLPLVIKLNTGMNRRGFLMNDLEQLLPKLKQRGIRHLMTHFARSASVITPGDLCHKQMDEFIQMKKFLKDSGVSIEETSTSNSGAIEQGFGVSETYVRPGLMLYGPPSVTDPILWNGKQTSRFVTKILSTFQAKKGTPIGYGVNVAEKDSFFVVLAVGYGDGFLTYYSGSQLKINGVTGKVFGRVNMDMIFVQFDPSAEKQIKAQDVVEIWNHDNKMITEFAIENKTHAYQVMCGISNRIPRIYKVK